MIVRLLLDENLSKRLLPLLSDRFADSSHVRLISLDGADDQVIGERARSEGPCWWPRMRTFYGSA